MKIPDVNWVLLAAIAGTFWGLFAVVFYRPPAAWKTARDVLQSILIIAFQFVFQFIGGFAGVMGLGLFLDRYSQGHFGIPELILLAISLVGVSGKLSDVIYRIPGFMNEFMGQRARKARRGDASAASKN
jgi:hypothetical protein